MVIRILTRPPGANEFNPIPSGQLDSIGPGDLAWIDIGEEDGESAEEILARLEMPWPVPLTETPPGIIEQDDLLFITLPTFDSDDIGRISSDRYRMVLGARTLVTIHDDPIPAIDRQWETTDTGPIGQVSIVEVAAMVAALVSRQVLPLIEQLELRIDGLEDLAFAADPRTLTEVHVLRRDVITLRRVISRQRDIMDDLSILVHPAIGPIGQAAFHRAFDHDSRLVDVLDSARSLLQSVSETYRGAVADQTNEIVRVLTVFSAILLPLGLIAGIWGMNFVDIPLSVYDWGFWAMIGGMAIFAISLWLYFSRRGFVGAPRLSELPKAVGLGLLQVGTAPVKAIAWGVGSGIQQLDRLAGGSQSGDSEDQA